MHILCLWRYLDAAGMKKSKAYIINGVVIFIAWMVGQVITAWNIFTSHFFCVFVESFWIAMSGWVHIISSWHLGHTCWNGLCAGCQNTFVRIHVLPCLLALRSGNNYWRNEFQKFSGICAALQQSDHNIEFFGLLRLIMFCCPTRSLSEHV